MKRRYPGESKFKKLEAEFEALANAHRLAILSYLKAGKSASVGQIADDLEFSFRIVSKHLLYLAKNGILQRRYDSPFVLYKIADSLPTLTKSALSHL